MSLRIGFKSTLAYDGKVRMINLQTTSVIVGSIVCCAMTGYGQAFSASVEMLIDQFTNTTECIVDYQCGFLPLPEPSSNTLTKTQSSRVGKEYRSTGTLEALVQRGAIAVPQLLAHLDDKRETRIPPVVPRNPLWPWLQVLDNYDCNPRVTGCAPADSRQSNDGNRQSYTIRVGDLCFVALGQIVNRDFVVLGWRQEGQVVCSPVLAPKLCELARSEFAGFTPRRHRNLLTQDLLRGDHAGRRIGAYRRLCYYYPDAVVTNVLTALNVGIYDEKLAHTFVRNYLYPIDDSKRRKALLDDFARVNGRPFRDGVLLRLFRDLELQEAGAMSQPGSVTRQCLITLFGQPKNVRGQNIPYVDSVSQTEMEYFVGGLVHDESRDIDNGVYDLFLKACGDISQLEPRHGGLVIVCLRRLAMHHFETADMRRYLVDRRYMLGIECAELDTFIANLTTDKSQTPAKPGEVKVRLTGHK
jgi:hypothetical protein